jgi:hypothetical protein
MEPSIQAKQIDYALVLGSCLPCSAQTAEAMHVVNEIAQPNCCFCPDDANTAHQFARHLMSKHIFNPGSHL